MKCPGDQLIKCTLCPGEDRRLEGRELRDHIAAHHLYYVRHKCESCDVKSLEATTLWDHFCETNHRVMFNRNPVDDGKESMLESVYTTCLKSHAEDSEAQKDKHAVPLIEIDDDGSDGADSDDLEIIEVSYRPPPPLPLHPTTSMKIGASITAGKDKVASVSKSTVPEFTSATLPRLPPPEKKVFRQVVPPVEEKKEISLPAFLIRKPTPAIISTSKPTTKQQTCRMCGVIVQSMLPDNRRNHVGNAHATHSLKCPADGCHYRVTGLRNTVFDKIRKHALKEHGSEPKKISTSAANRHREQKKVANDELDRLVSQCFDTQS